MQTTYKKGKKAGQPRPEPKPSRYHQEEAYILSCIDADGYDLDRQPETDKEKLLFLWETFNAEYGWNIKRIGAFKALVEWLQGLPSSIGIAFTNWEILELARKWGSLKTHGSTEAQEDHILECYWGYMAMRIQGLWNKHDIR